MNCNELVVLEEGWGGKTDKKKDRGCFFSPSLHPCTKEWPPEQNKTIFTRQGSSCHLAFKFFSLQNSDKITLAHQFVTFVLAYDD